MVCRKELNKVDYGGKGVFTYPKFPGKMLYSLEHLRPHRMTLTFPSCCNGRYRREHEAQQLRNFFFPHLCPANEPKSTLSD